MKECKYELCHNEPKGASAYCSNSCRAQQSRRNKTGATSEAQHVVNSEDIDGEVKLDQPATDVSIGVVVKARTTGCKSIPGDEDYQGCCEKVDGVWRVKRSV